MREEMIQYSETHHLFSPGDKIIVGVSGGADSVCLLYLLNSLRKEMNLSLFVLHVKHGIRGDDADRDAQFVRQLAGKWELPCFEVFEDVPAYAKKWGMRRLDVHAAMSSLKNCAGKKMRTVLQ